MQRYAGGQENYMVFGSRAVKRRYETFCCPAFCSFFRGTDGEPDFSRNTNFAYFFKNFSQKFHRFLLLFYWRQPKKICGGGGENG